MQLYTFFFMICRLSVLVVTGDVEPKQIDDTPEIEILMDKNNAVQNTHIMRRVEESLNLTCRVIWFSEKFHLSWHLPISSKNSKNRVVYSNNDDSSSVVIQHLQESDSGDYRCEAVSHQNLTSFSSVTLTVKNKRCGERFFTCLLGNCIQQRFVCDGHPDCKHGEDEARVNCGLNPCQGKITCEGRCIPMSWCCQPYNDMNCTIKMRPSCCHQITKPYIEHDPGYVTDQQRFSDINFLQTTIYTVIGCAMVFMLIVTILVVAICRVHMKRSLLSRYPAASVGIGTSLPSRSANIHHLQSEQHIPLYDLDVYLNRSPGLLVTYNINNGVQFVGHPIDPPPYCEVVASPPREGPPPPYASREDLENEALLQKSPTANNISGGCSGGASSSASMENRPIPAVSQSSLGPRINISSRSSNGSRNMDSLPEEEQPINVLSSDTESLQPSSSLDLNQTDISGV